MGKLQKPGEKPNRSGEYIERGPRGGAVSKPRQVTIEPGDDKLPPTAEKNSEYSGVVYTTCPVLGNRNSG